MISESNPFKDRFMKAWKSNPEDPIKAVMDEFECSIERAISLTQLIAGGGYGVEDIKNVEMQNIRTPQSVLKLLRYFEVDPIVVNKLLKLHKQKKPNNNINGNDESSYQELKKGTRLASMIYVADEQINAIRKDGFNLTLVPWYTKTNEGQYIFNYQGYVDERFKDLNDPQLYQPRKEDKGLYYVYLPQDQNVVDAIYESCTKRQGNRTQSPNDIDPKRTLEHLLNGLAFGYDIILVFNFVRADNKEFVDKICGNIDQWEQWSNPSKP